jgi:aminoglycoside phosphotransferase (APT) family kinase protein
MAVGKQRDLEYVRDGFERWFASRYPEREAVIVAPLTAPSAGLSSDTLFVDVTWDGGVDSLVARLPPVDDGLFPEYDLAKQCRIQQVLGDTDVPVAVPVALEEEDSWVGSAFLLMPRIPGRTLGTNPSYVSQGWLHDATAEDQGTLHRNFFTTLAEIHRLDWQKLGLDFVAGPGGPGLAAAVDEFERYLHWVSGGSNPPPVLLQGTAWCRENLPADEPPPSLLWGDVQMVNAVFSDDLRPAAIVDWEMAGIGPAEMDLGWFFALHGITAEGAGGDLPGFPDRKATIAFYEEALGRDVADIHWYEMFGLLRSGAIVVRIAKLLAAQGIDDGWLSTSNPTADRLRELLP